MIEIALCIAIIGFALVAILGVLPSAMRVQQDNRADTLIDQDGNYFMEAIRNGARGLDELTNYVETIVNANNIPLRWVTNDNMGNSYTNLIGPKSYDTGEKIIGILNSPNIRIEAEFRAISGAAVEKDPNSPVSFEYLLVSEVTPFSAFDPSIAFGTLDTNALGSLAGNLNNNLYEVRLTFRWPVSPITGQVGNNKKVFRTLTSGSLTNDTLGSLDWTYHFFQPTTFVPLP